MLVAFPSEAPGGLDAQLSAHFGHCAAFTLVTLEDDEVKEVKIVANAGHMQGACMAPVMLLKQHGVEALVAGGMGPRPLAGFQQVGITVYFNEGVSTVRDAVILIASGQARPFGPAHVCGGGGAHQGGCGNH